MNNNNFLTKWRKMIDQTSIVLIMLLFCFNLILVTTASPAVANRIGLVDNYFYSRQLFFICISSFIIISFSFLDKKWIKRIAIIGFLFNILMLILVKFYGFQVKGATRWINILGFSYQPSEFIKPFFAVVTGWILSFKFTEEFPSFQVCALMYFIVAAFLIMQPDFGMLVMITSVFGIQLFVAGLPMIWIIIAKIAGILGVFVAYYALPHVAKRINNFLDPESGENYQVSKSIEAFQHGGFYGAGPGEGTVKQLLPDSHTDFIFSVAGEEFGALICIALICIFAFFVVRILYILTFENDKFVQFAGVGIVSQFGIQSGINIGVTLNVLPTKGMTLPFISYGGSSTLAVSIAVGMLIGLTKRKTSIFKYRTQDISI